MTEPIQSSTDQDDADMLSGISGFLSDISGFFAALAIITMTVLVAINTIFRALPNVRSFTFAEEYTGYLFIAIAFLGLADTFRHLGHVRVTMVIDRFQPTARARVEVVLTLVSIVVMSILGWFGLQFFIDGFISGEKAQTVVQTPLWIPRLVVPVGIAVFVIALMSYLRIQLLNLRSKNGQNDGI